MALSIAHDREPAKRLVPVASAQLVALLAKELSTACNGCSSGGYGSSSGDRGRRGVKDSFVDQRTVNCNGCSGSGYGSSSGDRGGRGVKSLPFFS
jgi:hypothetical protein